MTQFTAHNNPNDRALSDADSYATIYGPDGRPVATVTRPRLYGGNALFTLSDTNGRDVAAFATSPTFRAIESALAAFADAGKGLADMTADELADAESDARALAAVSRDNAATFAANVFRASATGRAIRAERRAELAAERRAELAAERAAYLDSCAVALGWPNATADELADMTADELADADERAAERRAELESAFALNVRPATYESPVPAYVAALVANVARHGVAALITADGFGPRVRQIVRVQS